MSIEQSRYRIHPPAAWEALTPLYDPVCALVGLGRRYRTWLIQLADLNAGHIVLDVGCGTGSLAIQILQQNPTVVVHAVDPTPSALRLARKKAKKNRISPTFAEALAEKLPFPDATFDRALCSLALHHIPDAFKAPALAEIHRVLRSDGRFILADFETTSSWLFWGKYRSKLALQEWLVQSGFNTKHVEQRMGVYAYHSERASAYSNGATLEKTFHGDSRISAKPLASREFKRGIE